LASSPIDLPVHRFKSFDGEEIAWRELGPENGGGRPLVLIHGFFSTATVNWLRYGHAARIAQEGYRVIMPDLRGHGDSTKSHDAAAYPRDALADDGFALIEHLGLTDYDLGGYSLGGRTTMRMLARGATPGKAICGGMGLQGTVHAVGRGGHFRNILTNLGTFERGSPEWMAEAFLKTTGGDPAALLQVLETFVDTPIETIRSIETPVLVVSGKDDDDNGSAEALADALPNGTHAVVPGNHMSAVTNKALGEAMARFLAG